MMPRASSTYVPGIALSGGLASCLATSSLKYADRDGRVLLARDDLVDVVRVDGQRARVPQALGQRLAALLGVGHQLHREVALEPVLGRDQRLDVPVAHALHRHLIEVARADQQLLRARLALDPRQRHRGLRTRADVGDRVRVRLHLRAPGVEVVGRGLLGVEDQELDPRPLLLDDLLEARVALLEHRQARRVGADQDLALRALGDLRQQRPREVLADLDVGVADQQLDGVLGALGRRHVDRDQRHVLRAAVCSGRMNRSGVSVIIATPSFDVRVAAWKSCTCLGPLTSGGADSVSSTPGVSSAAAFAPSAISCAKFVVVVG